MKYAPISPVRAPMTALAALLLATVAVPSLAQDPVRVTRMSTGNPHEIMATEFDLAAAGYASAEYVFSGTASAYAAEGEMQRDGHWTTTAVATAPYVARFFVRRPVDPDKFDGTVHVEWLNVTGGADNAVSWKYGHVEMLRSGTAYIGVAVQKVGSDAARDADPERYESLSHPGDSFSYDIFAQVGQAIRQNSKTILPGLTVERLIAAGESQSATRLITYLNGIQMHHPEVYDGFLLLSSFAMAAPLSQEPQQPHVPPIPTRIRNDLDKPVLSLQTELELQAIINPPARFPSREGFEGEPLAAARQPDTDSFRLWELPGATHAGAYFYNVGTRDDGGEAAVEGMAMALLRPSGDKGGRGTPCAVPINADPLNWVYSAAMRRLAAWVAEGTLPPSAARIATVVIDGKAIIARDDFGNALGGIRTPYVDAPVATLNGWGFGEGFCFLNGSTVPFSADAFRMRYEAPDDFLADWSAAIDAAVKRGFILDADSARLQLMGERVRDNIAVAD